MENIENIKTDKLNKPEKKDVGLKMPDIKATIKYIESYCKACEPVLKLHYMQTLNNECISTTSLITVSNDMPNGNAQERKMLIASGSTSDELVSSWLEAINKLRMINEQYATLLELKHYIGYSNVDLAVEFDVSVGKIYKMLKNAYYQFAICCGEIVYE